MFQLAPRTTLLSAILAAIGPAAALGAAAPVQDVFSPSMRWRAGPTAGVDDWTPESVRFAGEGAFVWTSLRGGPDVLRLYDTAPSGQGSSNLAPRAVVPRHQNEAGVATVAAGERGDRIFALRQATLTSNPSLRSPFVMAYNPLSSANGVLTEAWTHDLNTFTTGSAKIATDRQGRIVVAAAWRSSAAEVRVDALDGTTGALFGSTLIPAIGLDGLSVSADGSHFAVTAGLELFIFDQNATLLHTEVLQSSTHALALSADGSTVVYGEIGALVALDQNAAGAYVRRTLRTSNGPEIPTRLDVSDDGTIIAVAWWNYSHGRDARLELYDTIFGFPLVSTTLNGSIGDPQNLPIAAHISANGGRAAFGLWGSDSLPEVVVLAVGEFEPVMSINLDGSARDIDFDDATSTRVAIAHKAVHAQTFSARGGLSVADSGERMLQTLETPTIGGSLRAAAKVDGIAGGWFLLGPKADTPLVYPGGQTLLLNRSQLRIYPALADADGRIDLDLPLPNNPALIGRQFHLQAAYRIPGGIGFSPHLESPYVLD